MLEIWITFFIIGNLLGYSSDWGYKYLQISSYILLLCTIFYVFSFKSHKLILKKSLVALCAIVWGFSNNVPLLQHNIKNASIIEQRGIFSDKKNIVIKYQDKLYQIKAKINYQGIIDIKCKPSSLFILEQLCYIREHKFIKNSKNNLFEKFLITIKESLKAKIQKYPKQISSWMYAIILGDKSNLSPKIKRIFKQSGAYHILVVSGFHVSIISFVIYYLIMFVPHILYLFKIINPKLWIWVNVKVKFIAIICAFIYSSLTGLNPPAQRAFIIFSIDRLSSVIFKKPALYYKILIALVIQTLLFPTMFVCESTIMSWMAYIFFVHLGNIYTNPKIKLYKKMFQIIRTQLKMMFLVTLCLGTFSPLGILTNLVLVPFFPLVLISTIILIILPQNWEFLNSFFLNIQYIYLNCFSYIVNKGEQILPLSQIEQIIATAYIRAIILLILTYLVYKNLKYLKNIYNL